MKILSLCFFPSFVPPSNGGESRLYNFYNALSKSHNVTLLTSSHIGVEEEVINHGSCFIERRIPKDDYFVEQYVKLEQYSGGGDLSGPALGACRNLPTKLHEAYLEEYRNADVLIFDDPFTANYDIFVGTDRKPRIYNSYNCESIMYEQLHPGIKAEPIKEIVRKAEKQILQNADLVLYCNDEDLSAFRKIVPDARFESLYVPNGMVKKIDTIKTKTVDENSFKAVFMGSGHPPNAHAAKFIVEVLARELPYIRFEIIGSCLEDSVYPKNVKRHGLVDEARKKSILGSCDIALNPMDSGSGSNVKVLEYFSNGLPVLSTKFGMRGIHAQAGRDYIESSLEEFAKSLKEATKSKEILSSIGERGKELGNNRYTWGKIIKPLSDKIDIIINSNKEKEERKFVLALNDYDSFSGFGGGCTRSRGIYEAVRELCPVVFVSFSNDGTLCARQADSDIIVINIPKTSEQLAEELYINSLFHISSADIIAGRHSCSNRWLDAVYRVLRQGARFIVVEHCYLAPLPVAWGDRFIYSAHNNETELKKRLLEWHPLKADLINDVETIERLAVEHSAATIAVSHDDAASLVRGKRTSGPVIVLPNGSSMPAPDHDLDLAQKTFKNINWDRSAVFIGSAHMPNVDSAMFIVDKIAPQCPDIQFHIIGSVCNSIQHHPKNITLWGEVDDLTKSAIFRSCALALNPMSSGGGSNVKIADFLIHGLLVITTHFGQRGYPSSIHDHIVVTTLDSFADTVLKVLEEREHYSLDKRTNRIATFSRELSMHGIAKRFVETLENLEKPKKRLLYVTYRYALPALGGAETNVEKFVTALGFSQEFNIDVIAPEVTSIHNQMRFCETYSFDPEFSVPIDIPNVRFARFPVDQPTQDKLDFHLRQAWEAQARYEKVADRLIGDNYKETGITWGWSYPEGENLDAARWAFAECGAYINKPSRINLVGYAPQDAVLSIFSDDCLISGPLSLRNAFSISFSVDKGKLSFVISVNKYSMDPRPLGIRVSRLEINGEQFDLSQATLLQKQLASMPVEKTFRLLDKCAEESRTFPKVSLTDGRGPWSKGLENFIENHIAEYDLVVTHNNVFRPAIVAIAEAKRQGVPSILIPHAHLDDDFYHFPDWMECARNASIVLAVPQAACDFLSEKGCKVRYLSAGCDENEEFTADDRDAFEKFYQSPRRFILVLGRKAGSKGYRKIIDAVEQLNADGVDLQAVLIGPDDDGIPVDSPNAIYLGRQPRNIVRGALLSCVALCNMSASESFGIVLLEAWLAGKPVIGNKNCAAFQDIATKETCLLVDEKELVDAIKTVLSNSDLCSTLAANGKKECRKYSWDKISQEFVELCIKYTK